MANYKNILKFIFDTADRYSRHTLKHFILKMHICKTFVHFQSIL